MRLIAITHPYLYQGEADDIRILLNRGWHRVHIRKPDASKEEVADLIGSIHPRYYSQISIHDHFNLAERFGLGGIHLNRRNPMAPTAWKGLVSRSCHSVEETIEYRNLDYLTLSPVFDSISKPGYLGRYDLESLKTTDLSKVYALGGVTRNSLPILEAAGFAGAAMLSAAWQKYTEMLQFITHTDKGLEEALSGGCRWVQLRMKDVSDEIFREMAEKVIPICRKYGAILIFDDRVKLAKEMNADGVHLGKEDMPLQEARAILGPAAIIGATANTAEDMEKAVEAGANYIGLGPFRFTTTKKRLSPILGIEGYRVLMSRFHKNGYSIPVVAIGGICIDDIPELRDTGVDGIAVSGTILNSLDIEKTTEKIIQKWKN